MALELLVGETGARWKEARKTQRPSREGECELYLWLIYVTVK